MTSERTRDFIDEISTGLIRRAARRAPDSLTARLEEEWLADLGAQRGPIARLRFAAGCWWAMGIIVREHAVAAVAASAAAVGRDGIVGVARTSGQYLNTRTTSFLLVTALHLAVLYGLMMARGPHKPPPPVPFTADFIDPVTPASHIAVTVAPTLDFRVRVPPPTQIPVIATDSSDAVEGRVDEAQPSIEPPLPPQPAVHRVTGGPGIGFPSPDEFYPDASIRMSEKGVTTVQVCVDDRGRLTGEPGLVASTGSSRLDAAALRLAKAGSGHYRPTTEEGKPISGCYSFLIRFQLKN
jgi:TonB family protein